MNKNMDRQIVAICVQEAGRLITGLLSLRTPKLKPTSSYQVSTTPPAEAQEVTSVPAEAEGEEREGVACVPCCNSHFSVCTGLVSDEAIRMARRNGIGDEEIRRINKCIDQLNAMEREDLSAEKMARLPKWEKDIAVYAQNQGAEIRHKLENLRSVDDLEGAAIQINEARTKIGKDWFKQRLANMSKEEKTKLAEKAVEQLGNDG